MILTIVNQDQFGYLQFFDKLICMFLPATGSGYVTAVSKIITFEDLLCFIFMTIYLILWTVLSWIMLDNSIFQYSIVSFLTVVTAIPFIYFQCIIYYIKHRKCIYYKPKHPITILIVENIPDPPENKENIISDLHSEIYIREVVEQTVYPVIH